MSRIHCHDSKARSWQKLLRVYFLSMICEVPGGKYCKAAYVVGIEKAETFSSALPSTGVPTGSSVPPYCYYGMVRSSMESSSHTLIVQAKARRTASSMRLSCLGRGANVENCEIEKAGSSS